MQITLSSITAAKGKHGKRKISIPVRFRIFYSSPLHLKYWYDMWEILQINRNHTDIEIR